ncbi:putative bifunctional diguanylate cyclase/phosphodiesterase [Gordonia aurantiaca]|uniref:putative bifunctional diguanylate cyclase/phosphodiesterase n=1 Tax=Gordonia sp. B21 TaxID=3151852 RepID=UPI0032655EEF
MSDATDGIGGGGSSAPHAGSGPPSVDAAVADRYRLLLDLSPDAIVVHQDGALVYANSAALTFACADRPRSEMLGRPLSDFVHPDDVPRLLAGLEGLGPTIGESTPLEEILMIDAHGTPRPMLMTSVRTVWLDRPAHQVIFRDLTAQNGVGPRPERPRTAWDAVHDPLTRLYNRTGILERLDERIAILDDDPASCLAIYYIDLDSFKIVNDSLGHVVGDEVLCTVARRLADAAPPDGTVGRVGGDEFVLVATHSICNSTTEIDRQVDAVRAAINRQVPVSVRNDPLTVRASIGVATLDSGDTATPTDLLRDADIALGQARKSAHVPYVHFRVQHREELQRRQRIEEELWRILESDPAQLEIHYQPIVSTETGALVALEALLRWNHPELGAISPTEFIPLAERSTLIGEIGAHVLASASAEVAAVDDLDHVLLSINVSRRELTDGEFLARLRTIARDSGRSPGSLCLEITESALAPIDHDLLTLLHDVRSLGVRISLDDFGTGASTLSELYRMPVQIMKTAKGFVDALAEGPNARTILSGIVAVAHSVGVLVIAEGVETVEQADVVAEVGCDFAQGYHYGHPRPLAEVLADVPVIAATDVPFERN